MASIIRIKRSSGTSKPASLQWGELGYVTGIGSYGGVNQYKDRVFLGDDGTNANPVGGYYYTSMMEHDPGAVASVQNTRNQDGGVVAVMEPLPNSGLGGANSLKVDQWNVDNLRIDTNTISSTDTDGDIVLDPNGTGEVQIPDDTFLAFGDDKDAKFEYDEDGVNQFTYTGADFRINVATDSSTKDTGALIVEGGVGIEKSVNIGANITVGGNAKVTGSSEFGLIKIDENIISSLPGSNNTIFIDPYPDGLSNEGAVIIKGDLQVDGTTTTINSTSSTLNDPIFHLGDVTSTRTVMAEHTSGTNVITLDSIVGINTGDAIAHANLPVSTTVSSYNAGTKVVTMSANSTAGISTTEQVTITHAYDSNTDRGISFSFNTSSGPSNNKTGFFGMEDDSIASSSAGVDNHGTHADDSRRWVYVPDAAVANSVVSGTKGFLDIKGIYYQSGDYATGGVTYFDSTGLQRSTNAVAAPINASKQILTAVTKKTFNLNVAITVSAGDIIRQDSTGAYGVVETGVTGSANVSLIGIEGTFTTGNNLRREGQNGSVTNLASSPDTITDIYTNKPHWTSTLDGGTF